MKNISKEDWWQYILECYLPQLDDCAVLHMLEEIFYLGYTCKGTENQIISDQIQVLSGLRSK